MPLPTIAVPKYPITIPSTKKETFFRPFLVKEQKILLMALESKDTIHMMKAMCSIIENCTDGIVNPQEMPLFDVEYIFAKIRAKSIGESIEVKSTCPSCDSKTSLTIEIDSIEVKFPEGITNKIMLTDKLGIILKYPSLSDSIVDMESTADGAVEFVCNSIDVVFDSASTYNRKDFTPSEILTFVESLDGKQFEQITEFYKNLPQLNKTIECKCLNCNHEYVVDFRGLQDFFT